MANDSVQGEGWRGELVLVGYLADGFDLLNVRDLDLISQATALCSQLIVGVLTDEDAERLYGRPPVIPLEERLALISHVRGVHGAVIHGQDWPADPNADWVIFTVEDFEADHPRWLTAGRSVGLSPRRHTASETLRDALLPGQRPAVA